MSPARVLIDPLLVTVPELLQPCLLSCAAAPHVSLRVEPVLDSLPFLLSQNQTDAGITSLRRLTCKSKHPAMKLTVPSIPNHEALNPETPTAHQHRCWCLHSPSRRPRLSLPTPHLLSSATQTTMPPASKCLCPLSQSRKAQLADATSRHCR
ncbi:hypothetical protein M0R45_026499 [Rubus argutus]|uniref:Uncharacterized protein n=1 Tax=Rubus argutus TaxID=59490 RepID=A0AAW1WYB4_RUBAR